MWIGRTRVVIDIGVFRVSSQISLWSRARVVSWLGEGVRAQGLEIRDLLLLLDMDGFIFGYHWSCATTALESGK